MDGMKGATGGGGAKVGLLSKHKNEDFEVAK